MSDKALSPLAIVGVSAMFPGSSDTDGFWRDILAGTDLIGPIDPKRWLLQDHYDPDMKARDKTYATRGAFLGEVDFDALGFGVPPSTLPATDTAQLLALIVAQRVLEDATGGQMAHLDRERVSVILGVTSAQELLGDMVSRLQRPVWIKALREMGLPESEVQEACDRISSQYVDWQEATFPGLLGNVVAGRIANRLDLHGTNCVTDAACASTFSALSMAANELWLGQSDLVVVGGVDTMNDIFMHMCFSKTPALSPTGECRPFSDKADGTLLGEGLAMFALRRLEDAERDGDRIYAVLKGIGTSSDGRSKSVYAPVSEGQARAVRRAYERSGYGPDTVELLEAHGTGTKAGDAAEFGGLATVFDEAGRSDRQWCALGTVKSQIGHTKAAAGAAGLFKAVLALRHKTLPPTIKVDRPNPALNIDETAFYLNTVCRPWVRSDDHPRRASVSSFGFGGSNFHLALEEYSGANLTPRRRVLPVELITLAAGDGPALAARAEALARGVGSAADLAWVAVTTQSDPGEGPARLAVLADRSDALVAALLDAVTRIRRDPTASFVLPNGTSYALGADAGKVGLLCAGQGSQYVGMGSEIARTFDDAIAVWDEARSLGGPAIDQVVFPVPVFDDAKRAAQEAALTDTRVAQPAIGAVTASHVALLAKVGLRPAAAAGHSFGELSALYAAGSLSLEGLIGAARARGEGMAAASELAGAMCAVGLDVAVVRARLAEWGLPVVVANHNHPAQVVVSGEVEAIAEAERRWAAEGVDVRRLKVSTAFHSPLVAGAVPAFRAALERLEVEAPEFSVYGDATAAPYPSEAAAVRDQLAEQLASPVRFVEVVEAMYAAGVRTFVEVGPGHVLTAFAERILGDRPFLAVPVDRKGKDGVAQLLSTLGRLFVQGVPLDLAALWQGFAAPSDPALRPKMKMAVPISGANYGRLYPPPEGASVLPGPNPPRPVPEPKVVYVESEPVIVERVVEVRVEVPVAGPAPVGVSAAPVVASGGGVSEAWLAAFQDMQRQTVQAQEAFQTSMAQSHHAFLDAMQVGMQGLASTLAGGVVAAPAPRASLPAPVAPVVSAPAPVAPVISAQPPVVVAPAVAQPAPILSAPKAAPVVSAPKAAPSVAPVVRAPAPVVTAAPVAAASVDLTGLLIKVVSEKTGYPPEMLSLEMDLEADLGVDSIKRVEILSAVREAEPGLPEVDAGELASLQTLGQIVKHLGASLPAAAAPRAVVAAVAAAPSVDLTGLLLKVVSEKTGYPPEMLSLEMDLEADLGVDSIKRVEILSAVREAEPGLPEVDAGELASLQTLGQIVKHLGASLPAAAAPRAAVAAVAAAPSVDLTGLLLKVVSEKTGYPPEMLSLEMDLEADLGVDSIKRVEILSAVREAEPGLPEVDAGELASLQTLGQIVKHLGASLPASAAPRAAVAAAPAAVAAAPSVDLTGLLLKVVSEKTGYPPEMLSLEMDLEADLGVDSIKRVEILSAVREAEPGLPEVDAGELASLQTLGQIVKHLGASLPAVAAPRAAVVAAPAAVAAAPSVDLTGLLLKVVSEKTGYPPEMLSLEMDLEADLGVDSIKRVEILSAVREAEPGLPEVDAGELASLQTLGQIVKHLGASLPAAAAPGAAVVAAPAAVAAAPSVDLTGLLLKVVSEKTGYPPEMLSLEMDLEADLGVDSIKRVEILSAVREAEPGLPEVDAGELASLQTLGQIVKHLGASLPAVASPGAAVVAAPAAVAAAPSVELPGRYVVELVEAPAVGLAVPGLADGELQVVDDGGGVADALVRELAERGYQARKVSHVDGEPNGVIYLGALRKGLTRADSTRLHEDAFVAAKAVAPLLARGKGVLVTVQDSGGDFGLSGRSGERAWFAGLPGLVKTARLEGTGACKAIDVEVGDRSAQAVASVVLEELLLGGAEVEVALPLDGSRRTLSAREQVGAVGAPKLGVGDVVLASGGARGVTAATIIALAADTKASFVLLGRTPLAHEPAECAAANDDGAIKRALMQAASARGEKVAPATLGKQAAAILAAREVRATLSAIEAAGGRARYVAVDVTDVAALKAALVPVRAEWGPVTGIVHGAGVLADKKLTEKTVEQFRFVFSTKIDGLQALLAATEGDVLKLLVLFSSVAARGGNLGQCDYAAANEVLNKVAAAERARRGEGCIVKALGWGPWEAGMVTPALKRHFESLGVQLIGLSSGAALLVQEARDGSPEQIELVIGGSPDEAALLGEGARKVRLGVRVDARTCPELDGHRVKGAVVVPVAMALEWLARAARAVRPDLVVSELRDLSVRRGIRLDRFDREGIDLVVEARQLENGQGATLAAELRQADGRVCYSATVRMESRAQAASAAPRAPTVEPWNDKIVYDGEVLFHGRSFQVIRSVQGVSKAGVVATLEGLEPQGWRADSWWSDPAAVDGLLQLGSLWFEAVHGAGSLPTGFQALRVYQPGPIAGVVRAVLVGLDTGSDRVRYDVALIAPNGAVLVELKGVTHHRLPGVGAADRRPSADA